MYYVLSGLIAVLVSVKYTKYEVSKQASLCKTCCEKIELVEKRVDESDTETLKKVMTTVLPIAKAVNKLNNEVGIR